jgi:hypothetical protein
MSKFRKENNTMMINDLMDRVASRYDGDNDLIPNAPLVTCTDRDLLDLIRLLFVRIEALEELVDDTRRSDFN